MKNHGYNGNYDMVVNLAQEMLTGCSLEAFLNQQQAQEKKNTHKAKEQREYILQHIYDCAIFEFGNL
jgi:hypothetical protein